MPELVRRDDSLRDFRLSLTTEYQRRQARHGSFGAAERGRETLRLGIEGPNDLGEFGDLAGEAIETRFETHQPLSVAAYHGFDVLKLDAADVLCVACALASFRRRALRHAAELRPCFWITTSHFVQPYGKDRERATAAAA